MQTFLAKPEMLVVDDHRKPQRCHVMSHHVTGGQAGAVLLTRQIGREIHSSAREKHSVYTIYSYEVRGMSKFWS